MRSDNRAMFRIVLVHPEIPPNTGNVIRLAANTGCELHLIEPLGFSMEDKLLRRAGLDYHEFADVRRHARWEDYAAGVDPTRCFAFSRRAPARWTALPGRPATASCSAASPQACRRTCAPRLRLNGWFACPCCRASAAST